MFGTGLVSAEIQIPQVDEWTDHGTILQAGTTWDIRLTGAISPCTVVKIDGQYLLYYIGADGDRSTDGGPRHRALGVAISDDGINFTKYAGNPVITFLPHQNQEEGVYSAAATLAPDGSVVMYYGALRAANSTTTTVDVYVTLATSPDGLTFDNRGDRGEFAFAPAGEEVDPIGVMYDSSEWYVYYINNSGWKLNWLSGPTIYSLSDRRGVSGTGGTAKGGGDPQFLNDNEFITFIDHYNTKDPLVLTGSVADPSSLAEVDRYPWGGSSHNHATTFLDVEAKIWLMYYQNKGDNSIGVKTAPLTFTGENQPLPKPPTDVTAQ